MRRRGQFDIGVDEHQDVAGGGLGEPLAGPRLAQPPSGWFIGGADHLQAGGLHQTGGVVAGVVVENQDLRDPGQRLQAGQRRSDPIGFVARGTSTLIRAPVSRTTGRRRCRRFTRLRVLAAAHNTAAAPSHRAESSPA